MLERMRQDHPGIDEDAVSVALARLWRGLSNNPENPQEVLDILEDEEVCPCGPVVVCMSPIDIPRVGERHFEPYVVNATELRWSDLKQLPLSWVWWWWMLTPIGGWSGFFGLRNIPTLLVCLGIPAAGWVWYRGVRSRYVRIAPGIVQVMTYSLFGGKPSIRGYPMEKGTLVLIIPDREKAGVDKVILSRGNEQDVLPISGMKDGPEVLEKLLWAVMSTAPIPDLDDELLVG
jgi:hypothetical protein